MERLIMVVTNDEYELPVVVGETYNEVARALGMSKHTIEKSLKRGNAICRKKYRVRKVLI